MLLYGRCAELAGIHFNLSFTHSDNEALTSQQMGLAEQFCSLLTVIVPEHAAFLSSGVAFRVRDSGCWSHNNMELLDKHMHMHQSKMMAAAVSALRWSHLLNTVFSTDMSLQSC